MESRQILYVREMYRKWMLQVKGSNRGQMQDGDQTDGHYITMHCLLSSSQEPLKCLLQESRSLYSQLIIICFQTSELGDVWDVDFLERWEYVQVKVCLSKIALMIIAYSYQTSYIKHYSTKFDHDLFKCQASFVLCVMYLLIMNYTL